MVTVEKDSILYEDVQIDEYKTKDGDTVHVTRWIPHKEKEAAAIEWAERIAVSDDDAGVVYECYYKDIVEQYIFCKYYTDIDVSLLDNLDGYQTLSDWLMYQLEWDFHPINTDFDNLATMKDNLIVAAMDKFAQNNNLLNMLRISFGSFFQDKDWAETLAKSQDINGQMAELLDVYRKKKEAAENEIKLPVKKGHNTQLPDGAVLNFSKK